MKPKVATARAVVAYVGQKSLRFASLIIAAILLILFIVTALLAINVSPWWWLLLVPLAIIGVVVVAARWILTKIIGKIYRHPYSRQQREQLDSFNDKIQRLIEARATPLPLFAFITLWDIIRRRDATTLRSLLEDSSSLRSDFRELEKHFGER